MTGGPGRRNLLTDVAGLRIGHADDRRLRSGVTVLLPDRPVVGAVDIRGGGPGTRDLGALCLEGTVTEIHGLVLSGGSAFGLSAATGVQSWLKERGIGLKLREARVPIVPGAILFDLLNGGDKNWGPSPPYEALARTACETAGETFALGSAGAGFGATTATLRGGLGSASLLTPEGFTVGALAAVNPAGDVTIGAGPHFRAAPFEIGGEFGGLGLPTPMPPEASVPRLKGGGAAGDSDAAGGASTAGNAGDDPHSAPNGGESTTLAIIATDAALTKSEAYRLAVMAQTGLALAIWPVHTPLDGDIVFALSTGERPLTDPIWDLARLGAYASTTLARAIARGVFEAAAFGEEWPSPPAWRERFR